MRATWILFAFLTIFYVVIDVIYFLVGGEELGVTAIALCAGLALLIGFYIWFSERRQGGKLPEDKMDGDIAEAAGEIGFFPPHSWWPLWVSFAIMVCGVGLIVGWWLTLIGVGALLITVLGFVLEYESPKYQSH